MVNVGRVHYERVKCPGCERVVSAYIPFGGDGSGLRLVKHSTVDAAKRYNGKQVPLCRMSGRIIIRREGKWILDP